MKKFTPPIKIQKIYSLYYYKFIEIRTFRYQISIQSRFDHRRYRIMYFLVVYSYVFTLFKNEFSMTLRVCI